MERSPFSSLLAPTCSDPEAQVTDLEYQLFPDSPGSLHLVSATEQAAFNVGTLEGQRVESLNLCNLRPAVYSRYFRKRRCEGLTLDFGDNKDMARFMETFLQLQALALDVSQLSPAASAGNVVRLGSPRSVDTPSSSAPNRTLDDRASSRAYTVKGEDGEVALTECGDYEDVMSSQTLPREPRQRQAPLSLRSRRHASSDGRNIVRRWLRG